jgi:TolB-like protein
MNRFCTVIALFFMAVSLYGQSRGVSLDTAVHNSALEIQERMDNNSTIVVYQFESLHKNISDYVLKELFDKLVNFRTFTVLDRSAQEVIDAELEFQFVTSAGMISDDSLASLTQRLGAQAIVTGSLDDAGGEYRFRVRVIGTETTAALVSYSISVDKKDKRIEALSRKERSAGEKIGTGGLNILFGLGSYLEGDTMGGITITAGFAVAIGLSVVEATMLDWDSPAVGIPGTLGLAIGGLSLVYGFARPFIYHHKPQVAVITDNIQFRIVPVSDTNGNRHSNFGISYTFTY